MKPQRLAATLVLLMLPLAGARAADTTTSFTVTASVVAGCTLVGGVPLAFGVYSPGVQNDATTTFTATCTTGTSYTLKLDAGTGSGASFATRKMTDTVGGVATLDYSLYSDAGRSTVWGDGTGGSSTVASSGTGVLQTFTVYGRIPSSAAATIGTYVDTITVTATY